MNTTNDVDNIFTNEGDISDVNFILKNIYTARASIKKHGTANAWPWSCW